MNSSVSQFLFSNPVRTICWLASASLALAQDSVVVFNEIHYQSSDNDPGQEWIELHNQMAVDVDISGWRLRGGIKFEFPADTIVEGGGFIVVAADPAELKAQNDSLDVFGPFEGRLDNSGDTLRLEDRSTLGTVPGGKLRHRVMDIFTYDDGAIGAEEVGASLAKIDPDGGTAFLNNWSPSHVIGGTPGAANFPNGMPKLVSEELTGAIVINEIMYHQRPFHATPEIPGEFDHHPIIDTNAAWQFDDRGSAVASDWQVDSLDWPEGTAPFGVGLDNPAEAILTTLSLRSPTSSYVSAHYFRKEFTVTDDLSTFHDVALRLLIDDGAAVYLNGVEIHRSNLPEGTLNEKTSALDDIGDPQWLLLIDIDPGLIQMGSNVLAIEVHQKFTLFNQSKDAAFAAELFGRVATKLPIPAQPHRESEEEWIELYNRSATSIDMSGWRLRGGVRYEFPEGSVLQAGAYLVVDAFEFEGRLSNRGERLVLADQLDQAIDAVHYQDGGRWPKVADGYGASLELRDPNADNACPEAWAASDERPHSEWQTYRYEGVAEDDGIGTGLFHELVIGMLDAGEILVDDVSVIENPHGTAEELMQHGDFEDAAIGTVPEHWLAVGTHGSHGRTRVIDDPDTPGNKVLHLVATGATEDKHNQLTSVYADNKRIQLGETYQITFRAKWLSGSNLLNTRLYFNYLQRSTRLAVPATGGTPGNENSMFAGNIGPMLDRLTQSPVLPTAQQPVNVEIHASDPDGIASVKLTYAINGGSLFSGGTHVIDMLAQPNGTYTATVPGRSVGDLVRIHVTATDSLGNLSQFPKQGQDARALFEVVDDDTNALADGPHRLRVLMEKKDREFLFDDAIRMSNDRLLGTVIYKDIAYHNVGIRLKGSAWARNNAPFQGLNIRFDPQRPFRGVHEGIALERDPGKGEILAHHLFYAAGGNLPSIYSDVVQLAYDQASFSGPVLLLMARTSSPFLRGAFDNASEGTVYNLELLYTPQATLDRQPESPKRNFPYTHDNGRYDFRKMGPNKEAYRWGFQIRSARNRDNYAPLVRVAEAMELEGARLDQATEDAMDIDQWARAFAMMALNGNDDFYTRLWEHNLRLYHRPEDDRLLALPWDFDRAWRLSASSPLIGGINNAGNPVNLPKVLNRPQNSRLFYGHLLDLLDSVYNPEYIEPWADHYGGLFRSNLGSVTSYVRSRANYARRQVPEEVPFTITTNGGDDFTIDQSLVTLQGRGWVNVREIRLAGEPDSLPVTWKNEASWKTEIPVAPGANTLTLFAYDMKGAEIGSTAITVTSTSSDQPYQQWKQANAITDDLADSDQDGLPSILEYAFGGSLEQDSSHLLPTITTGLTGNGVIVTIMRRDAATDVSVSFEVSSDLQQWATADDIEVLKTESVAEGLLRQDYRISLGDRVDAGYVRTRMTFVE